jgi:DNA end-binding protein Ku
MPQAIWTGSISFGLINIPVKLYPATKPGDVRFREVQRGTGRRIRHQRVVETEASLAHRTEESSGTFERAPGAATPDLRGEVRQQPADPDTRPERSISGVSEVDRDEVVKGFDLGDDGVVTVTEEELRELRPERSESIDLEEFVGLQEIDPIFFERSYFLAPQRGVGAEKPYMLLLRALQDAGKIGVARFVLRTKEHLAAIRPMGDALALETLFHLDEVRPVSEIANLAVDVEISDRELQLAQQFIEMLSGTWMPDRYRDRYRERVLELIRRKAGNVLPVERPEESPSGARVSDLMEALKASVETVKAAKRSQTG